MFDPDTEPVEHPERFIHTVEFTDGMGRAAADPHPGRQRHRQHDRPARRHLSSGKHRHRRPSRPRHRPARRRQRLEGLRQQGPPRPHLRTVLRRRLRLRHARTRRAHHAGRGHPALRPSRAAHGHDRPRRQPDPRRLRHATDLQTTPRRGTQPVGNLHLRRQRQRRPHPPDAHPRTRRAVEHTSQHAHRRARPHRPDRATRPRRRCRHHQQLRHRRPPDRGRRPAAPAVPGERLRLHRHGVAQLAARRRLDPHHP